MTHLSLVSQYGVRIMVVLVLSTLAGLAVTVLGLHLLQKRANHAAAIQPGEPHA